MPRCFSSSIQSEAVARWFLRAVTAPARWMALPYSRNFSVSVVLPASGWEMIAKVRRRAISWAGDIGGRAHAKAQRRKGEELFIAGVPADGGTRKDLPGEPRPAAS